MLKILREEIDEVQITSQHDAVCDGCPEKGKDKCKVAGIEWSPELLQDFDEAVIRNTDGLLELGKSYDPKFLIDNIDIIRKAIKRTVLEIPELLKK